MALSNTFLRLVYASRARLERGADANAVNADLARILMQSRKNNPMRQLVGALYYSDGCFFQVLEGPRDSVDQLYAKLHDDPRHYDLKVLSRSEIAELAFSRWSMKFVPRAAQVRDLLARYQLQRFDPYSFAPEVLAEVVSLLVNGQDSAPIETPLAASPSVKAALVPVDHSPQTAEKALLLSKVAIACSLIALAVALFR
jgi:Sensors of blue-light using FAD